MKLFKSVLAVLGLALAAGNMQGLTTSEQESVLSLLKAAGHVEVKESSLFAHKTNGKCTDRSVSDETQTIA